MNYCGSRSIIAASDWRTNLLHDIHVEPERLPEAQKEQSMIFVHSTRVLWEILSTLQTWKPEEVHESGLALEIVAPTRRSWQKQAVEVEKSCYGNRDSLQIVDDT